MTTKVRKREIEKRSQETSAILKEIFEATDNNDIEGVKRAVEKNSKRENIWDFLVRIKK